MKPALLMAAVLVVPTMPAVAQQGTPRAWQQRIDVAVDLPVPVVELSSVNPFAIAVDQLPTLRASTAPRKLDVGGTTLVAAYVNAKGECLGGVPLELPFPGLTGAVLDEITGSRFDSARIGDREVASWVVIAFDIAGRIKESAIGAPNFELPDPELPPTPIDSLQVAPSGLLLRAPYERQSLLTKQATPRRLQVKSSSQDADVPIRALIHITSAGRCDRFVPLNLDSGLNSWLSAYLATWRLDPAQRGGEPHEAWLLYSARARIKLSGLDSTGVRVVRDRSFSPPGVDR